MNATETKDKIEFLKNECAAFESRLESTKGEIAGLQRRKESLKKEIESAIAETTSACEARQLETRQEAAKVHESAVKLEADKAEFQSILSAFKKDQVAFEREKQSAIDTKDNYQKMKERLDRFMTVIRREYEVL